MNKNCKLTIGAMLLLTTAFSVTEVRAQTCVVPPTCEGLGYDKTASDCGGLAKLRCPFDDSKYFCTAYRNPDGSAPVTVGDIVYSDGTYANPEILQPTKKPIGVIYNSNGGYFVAFDDYGSFRWSSSLSCSGYTTGASTWSVPTENQLKEMYKNITTLNASIDLFAKTKLEGKYVYTSDGIRVYYVDMLTGQSGSAGSDSFPTRCVNTLANLANGTTPTPTTYKVGDTYVKDGVALGKVVEVDSTGKHGYIAISGGNATAGQATANCMSKTAGGLNWSLASGNHACKLIGSTANGGCDTTTANGNGYCYRGNFNPNYGCSSASLVAYVCEAPF